MPAQTEPSASQNTRPPALDPARSFQGLIQQGNSGVVNSVQLIRLPRDESLSVGLAQALIVLVVKEVCFQNMVPSDYH